MTVADPQDEAVPAAPAYVPGDALIRQLPVGLVNRIAAGEVIERPASVVKELVENSIDAGATRIEIDIEDGGLSLIRIADNGCGIRAEQLPLAFAEHATSKLSCDEDLFRIATKGFRGEALASIGSVSHTRLLSRTASGTGGNELLNNGGEIGPVTAAAGPVGTTIEVRNLFFNVPARRKFMKGPGTEFGHISEMVLRLSLPHPNVAFVLRHNNRASLELPAADAITRLLAAWPAGFAEQRLALSAESERRQNASTRIWGIVGLPEIAHPTTKYQFVYVNGRPVRDKYIQHALKEAYRGLTEPGRHPAAVLLIEAPPDQVDVNVHPTKSEVRFRDSGSVHGLVLSAVREVLLAADLTPGATMRSDFRPGFSSTDNGGGAAFGLSGRQDSQLSLQAWATPPLGTEAGALPARTQSAPFPAFDPADRRLAELLRNPPTLTQPTAQGVPPPTWQPAGPSHPLPHGDQTPMAATAGTDTAATPSAGVSTPAETPVTPSALNIPALQLHNSYLVVETEDGLQIIDQHALHERIVFEQLLARVGVGKLESQRMLLPLTIPASARQMDLLATLEPVLTQLGIEVSPMGPATLAIQAFPSFLERLDAGAFIADLLERSEQDLTTLTAEALMHEVLDMMACKAAVKAGDPLSREQIDTLLAQRHLIDRSSNCPHGRPTTLRLTLKDLDKQFKRSGF